MEQTLYSSTKFPQKLFERNRTSLTPGILASLMATAFVVLFFNATPSMATPITYPRVLNADERLADQSIFQLKSSWDLSGTLDGTASFTRTYTFPDKNPFSDDPTRNVTGSRNFISTATSYEEQFNGQYQDAPKLSLPWSAVDQSWPNNNLYDDGSFDGTITPQWGQAPGWKTITGAYEQFSQIWGLSKTLLNPGELNCPTMFNGLRVKGCPVTETWWGGGLDLKAGASLEGSIANTIIGTELTSLTLQLDRVLDYKIDSKSARIASINSGVYELKLTDASSGLQDVNIKFNATINGQATQLNVSGDTVWRQAGPDIETANPSYQLQALLDKYLIDNVRAEYIENLVDFPTMRLGILMQDGTGATGSAFIGAFNPISERQAVIRVEVVPEPSTVNLLALGMLAAILSRFNAPKAERNSGPASC